jgi:hypothetical protein
VQVIQLEPGPEQIYLGDMAITGVVKVPHSEGSQREHLAFQGCLGQLRVSGNVGGEGKEVALPLLGQGCLDCQH